MASDKFGYRNGPIVTVKVPIDASTPTGGLNAGDMVVLGTAGYVQGAAAGELVKGVVMDKVAVPAADGDSYANVNISREAVYEYPPDTGTVTVGLLWKTCDVGGTRSVNIDATVNDDLEIVQVDVDANTVYVRLRPTYSGV